ncbi:hypothetical protein RB597_007729 [Gaeumannomyces tritici]
MPFHQWHFSPSLSAALGDASELEVMSIMRCLAFLALGQSLFGLYTASVVAGLIAHPDAPTAVHGLTARIPQSSGGQVPSADAFYRRAHHRVVVLGDALYIDGGEVSQIINGTQPKDQVEKSSPASETLSIPLKSSWEISELRIESIEKRLPPTRWAAVWAEPSGNSFSVWGGSTVATEQISSSPVIGTFSANDRKWAEGHTTAANEAVAAGILRSEKMGFARADGTVFMLGGAATRFTDTRVPFGLIQATPGLYSLDLATGRWTNESAAGEGSFSKTGTWVGGRLEHVPGFGGRRGVLVALGGAGRRLEPTGYGAQPSSFYGFSEIKIYDIERRRWHTQTATGSVPSERSQFCSVGVPGQDGTYEIFVYGGTPGAEGEQGQAFDGVYVLSLPGFFWSQATSGTPRAAHSCAAVGKRQMISVGGLGRLDESPDHWTTKDPWRQGVGVFDMTELQWRGGYDVNAAKYRSPQVVVDWYKAGNANKIVWASPATKDLFATANKANPENAGNNTSSNGGGGSSTDRKDETSKPTDPTATPSVNIGLVVGVVVGSAALLGMLAMAVILVRMRRRLAKPQEPRSREPSPERRAELQGPEVPTETPDNQMAGRLYEADGSPVRAELQALEVPAEIPGNQVWREKWVA